MREFDTVRHETHRYTATVVWIGDFIPGDSDSSMLLWCNIFRIFLQLQIPWDEHIKLSETVACETFWTLTLYWKGRSSAELLIPRTPNWNKIQLSLNFVCSVRMGCLNLGRKKFRENWILVQLGVFGIKSSAQLERFEYYRVSLCGHWTIVIAVAALATVHTTWFCSTSGYWFAGHRAGFCVVLCRFPILFCTSSYTSSIDFNSAYVLASYSAVFDVVEPW